MARQSRSRMNFGRVFSPRSKSAAAVASVQAQEKRRKTRVKRWRERFKRFSLSAWHENAIVQTVCGLFRAGSDTARAVRAATSSQYVGLGVGNRSLRMEGLEARQMLNATYHDLSSSNFGQDWSNTSLITTNHDWSGVPSIIGYVDDLAGTTTGVDPQTLLGAQTTASVLANQINPNTLTTGGLAEFHSLLVENFDGYANQAAFESAWAPTGTSGTLSSAQSMSAPNSINFGGVVAGRNSRSIGESGTVSATNTVTFSFDFYDSNGAAAAYRQYAEIIDGAASATGQIVAMGLNNNIASSHYMARLLGYDGGTGTSAFFKLDGVGAPTRSTGWHNLKVEITATAFNFYVDNVLSKTVAQTGTLRSYDAVRVGSNLTAASNAAFFDNVKVDSNALVANNPVIAMQGSGTADAPNLVLHMDSTGRNQVTVSYNLRDIDGSADDTNQQVALQYRLSDSGDFINVPTGYVTDASSGPSLATLVTPISVSLPDWSNVANLQFRIITTNAASSDEWIGVDDISVTSAPITTTYVDDDWSAFAAGQIIADADPVTAGNQAAKFGTDAFASITTALATVLTNGTVIVNAGTYSPGNFDILNSKTLKIIGAVDVGNADVTANDGTLQVDASLATTGGVAAISGGMIQGTGTINAGVFVNGGGTLAAGTSPGTLSVMGNLTFNNNSTFAVDVDGTGANDHDLIDVTGNVNINGTSTLVLTVGYAPVAADAVPVITYSGTLGGTSGTFAYTTTAGFRVKYNAGDVTLVENSPPVGVPDAIDVLEGGSSTVLVSTNTSVLTNDTDADLDILTVADVNGSGANVGVATPTSFGSVTVMSDGTFSYTHDGSENFNDSFTYSVTDGIATTTAVTVSISITPVNDNSAVIGGALAGGVIEDVILTTGGLATVTDADTGEDKFQTPSGLVGTFGTFTFDEMTGAWTYTLDNGSVAVQSLAQGQEVHDMLSITSFDGSASDMIDVTILGTNDAAAIGGDTTGDVTEDSGAGQMDSGTLTISDDDAGEASFVPAATVTTYGSYTLDAAGNWTYTLDNANAAVQALNNGDTLLDSFTAVSVDGTTQQVGITIHGVTDPTPIVTVTGNDNVADSLVLDFSTPPGTYSLNGGTPVSLAGVTVVNYYGGNGAGSDSLTIIGADGGTHTYDFTNASDGTIDLGTITVNYFELEPITNTGTAADAEFNLPVGADNATLSDIGGGMLRLSGTTFEDTDFAIPSNSLTINGGAGDTLLVTADITIAGSITLNVPTISLSGDLDAPTIVGGASTLAVNVLSNAAEIQDAIVLAATGATINVGAGTFDEDVNLNKDGLQLLGAGAASTTIRGVIGGADGATIRIAANNLEIAGLTITRDGNTVADWNNPNLNFAGIAVNGQALTGANIHDNIITGNRTGIDINNSNGHTVQNNIIDNNHTGMIFRNQTDNTTVTENVITNNRTVGVLFLDASGGSNVPVQQALNSTFSNNDISGNWYGGIVDRQAGGSLPAPGTNPKNFSGNWYGTASPVVTTANSMEPGYASLIPVIFGGAATDPGGAPDIAGPASANFDYSPYLVVGTDTNLGEFGFQGDYGTVTVTSDGSQTGATGRINEGIAVVDSSGTVKILGGTFVEDVDASAKAVTLSPGASPGQVSITGNLTLTSDDVLAIEINGLNPATHFDNFLVSGTATLGTAALAVSGSHIPSVGNTFTVIDAAALSGALSTTTAVLNGFPLSVTYPGGGDVVLSLPQPTTVWVDDDWTITTDIGAPGLSAGDTVESGVGETAVSGLTFGYDAFATIVNAITAVATSGTINVLAGTYLQTLAPVAINIAKSVTIAGQDETVVSVDANGASTGIQVQAGNTVGISGIAMSNYSSTGVRVQGTLMLADSTLSGGFVGVWVDSGMLDMDSTAVTGVGIFGVQVGGGSADIDDSEISGVPTAAASVVVSAGTATIDGSVLTGSQRGLLVNASGTATLHGSSVAGTALRGVENATATPVDASGNWWGTSASEAAVQTLTLGQVDFTPYLNNDESVPNQAVRGFTADNSHVHVTALGSQVGGGRIQEGVDLIADGSLTGGNRIVDVHAGTYVENVAINDAMTLRGANFGTDPTNGGIRGTESIITAASAVPALIEVSAAGVTIDGFTVDGDDLATRAIRVNEVDNAVVRNNIITAAERGVQYNGSAGGNTGGLVEQNLIQNLSTSGTSYGVLAFDASYASVMNNEMTGLDVGIFEQYFYQPNGGGNPDNVISGNDIEAALLGYGTNERSAAAATTALSGNVYTIGAGGVGVQLYNIYKPGGITLTNETITGAHLGVYAYVNGGSVSITGSSITGDDVAGSIGVQLTNYLADFPAYATSFSSDPGALTISGSDISGFKTGVFVEDADADFDLDLNDDATGTVTATITSDTDITGADTGVLVSGPAAAAIITGNGGSIHGNTVGIDVDGGSATVTGNHIYDNGTGVWFHNGGAGSVAGNDFNDDTLGDTDDDNETDILISATAGVVTIGDGNDYAGDDYYIENLSSQSFDLTSHGAATYEASTPGSLPDDFRIEDHMFHGPDNGTSGVVYWVAGELFVSAPGTHINDETIQNAVDVANAGETVNVEAGTFSENLLIGKDIKIIGDAAGGTTLTSAVASSKLISVLGAGVFGTADDLVQISNLNLDGASLAAYGVYVEGTADLGTLTVDSAVPASVSNFKTNGVYVDAAAYLSGSPSVSAMVQQVNLTNLSFANNGISGGGGMGDVNFFGFNNDATFTDLDLVGNRNEGGGTGARLAIQLRGTGDASGVGSAAMGNVQFVNVDVSGKYRNQMIGIQRYTDVSSLSLSGVELGGATSEITGGFGASLRFDAVGNGSVTTPATVDLGDTTFRGLAGSSAQPHEIEFAPDNLHTFLRADGTNTTWVIGGTPFAASALTLPQAFAVEDRILHYVDKLNPTHALTFGPYKGFVDIQAGKAFITDQADSGIIGDGSITRGASIVTLGGTVHVEDGAYFEDVVVDRGVTVLGDSLPTIHAIDDNDNSSVVIEVRADNVTIQGLDVVVNRDDASGGIAASNVAQADVNMTGGSFNNLMILDNVITPVGENNVGSFVLHTTLPATTMGIALIGIGGPAHSVTIQGNQILADLGSAPITGGPLAASIFTRGIYLGELQATVGGSGVGEGNTSTGLAQDLLVQFASNGTTTIEGNTFLIAGVDITSPNANSPVNITDNTFAPPDFTSVPGFPLQSLLIRNFTDHVTSPITIDGNIFDDFNLGIDVEAGSATITGNTLVNVDDGGGDTIGAAAIGIRVRVGASAVISDDNDITGTSTGVLVLGSATIVDNDNSINGNGIGIDVDGGTALVQNNDLNGNTIGVLIQNGGIADLGQTSGSAVNFTGLSGGAGPNGASAGGNDFSSYTAAATAGSGAIVNLNTNGLNANPGRQGAPPDVTAFGNIWDTPTANGIENVVWHDSDNSALGFVDFAAFGNLVVTPTSPTTINEGGSVSIDGSFTNVPQAHTITIVWGDGSPNTVINNVSGDFDFSSSHTYVDDVDGPPTSSMHQITVTVQDASLATIGPSAPIDVTVNDVTPSVTFGLAPTTANDGDVKHYTFTTSDPGDDNWVPGELGPPTITVTTLTNGATGLVSNIIFDPITGDGSFDVTFSVPPGGGTAEVKVQVPDDDGLVGETSVVVGVSNTLHVTSIVVNDSGFDLTFNRAIELADLNLYDYVNPLIIGDTFKLPDMVVHASIANVDLKGSVVWDPATNMLSWVKTGGPLGSDNYTVTLTSGSLAFRDTFGNLLDGNNDGTAGDDYVQAFNVNVVGGTPVVSLPDFARGPGQGVDLTANSTLDTTLPVRATGVNVQGVDFKLVYDTTLLTINPAQLTAVLPNWSVVANQTVLGNIATLTVAAFANLPSAAFTGTTNVVNIIATVPSSAPYGASQVLRLTNSEVNEINAQDDFAIQKVVFPGDANGSGILPLSAPPSAYTAFDASLIAQVVVGSNGSTGFDASPLVDPAIVGDASGNGSLSAFDASLINQEAAGINTPEVPDETAPGGGGSVLYDPELSIPDNIPVATGHNVQIPVNITIEPSLVGTTFATYTVNYDTTKLDFIDAVQVAPFTTGWSLNYSENVAGIVQVAMSSSTPSGNNGGLIQPLSALNFFVLNAAGLGNSDLFINPVDPDEGELIWTKNDGSVNITRLEGDYNFDGVVDSGDYVVWRNMEGMTVPAYTGADGNGDTMIDGIDYAIWRAHFGDTFPGAGSGSSGTSAGSTLSSGEPIIESSSLAAAAATSAGGSVEFVETSQVSTADTSVAPAARIERQVARDEALVGLAESLSESRTLTRLSSARVTRFGSSNLDSLDQETSELLFDLAVEQKPMRKVFEDSERRATNDEADVNAIDELFAELDDEWVEIGAGA